jgi:hypothetical protein
MGAHLVDCKSAAERAIAEKLVVTVIQRTGIAVNSVAAAIQTITIGAFAGRAVYAALVGHVCRFEFATAYGTET